VCAAHFDFTKLTSTAIFWQDACLITSFISVAVSSVFEGRRYTWKCELSTAGGTTHDMQPRAHAFCSTRCLLIYVIGRCAARAGGPHAVNDGAFVRSYDDYKLRCVGLIGRRRARRRKQDMTVCTVGLCPGAIATGSAPQTHTHARTHCSALVIDMTATTVRTR